MRFKVNFNAPDLDLNEYKRYLHEWMEDWLKQSAREWLRATVIAIVPVWSNASRATFKKLAQEVDFPLAYGPQISRKDRKQLGLDAGSDSGLEIDTKNYSYHFKYHSTLRYLAYNEYNRVIYGVAPNVFSKTGLKNSTPYDFQTKGRVAFEQFIRYTELPNPFKSMKTTKV